MSEWAAKRFWKEATPVVADAGYTVTLDGRPVKTPAKAPLIVPTADMAGAIAAEWDAQVDKIDPLTMPVTRGANAAIDKVTPQKAEVIELLAAYGDSDLLCYRAAGPVELVTLQATQWDPILDWAHAQLGARLQPIEGVMHIPQDPASLSRLSEELQAMTPFQLAGAHDLISLSGSLVLALAVMRDALSPQAAWALSRLDEEWQITQWGEDEDARALERIKAESFENAARFFRLSGS